MTDTLARYRPPDFKAHQYNCPFCHTYASQGWGKPSITFKFETYAREYPSGDRFWISACSSCREVSLWMNGEMVYPLQHAASPPNPDLSDAIKQDYEEAASILPHSPRGAAALLRLAIQKLCKHLGEKGHNINEDIASLVKKGLPAKVQQSLDIVRVVGNSAVHPGQIDLKDDRATAEHLFGLVNLVAEVMITQPKHVQSLFDSVIPQSQKDAIQKRDADSSS